MEEVIAFLKNNKQVDAYMNKWNKAHPDDEISRGMLTDEIEEFLSSYPSFERSNFFTKIVDNYYEMVRIVLLFSYENKINIYTDCLVNKILLNEPAVKLLFMEPYFSAIPVDFYEKFLNGCVNRDDAEPLVLALSLHPISVNLCENLLENAICDDRRKVACYLINLDLFDKETFECYFVWAAQKYYDDCSLLASFIDKREISTNVLNEALTYSIKNLNTSAVELLIQLPNVDTINALNQLDVSQIPDENDYYDLDTMRRKIVRNVQDILRVLLKNDKVKKDLTTEERLHYKNYLTY